MSPRGVDWLVLDVCFNSGLETMHQVEGRERGEAEVGGVHREGCFRQAFAPGTAELIDEDAEGSPALLIPQLALLEVAHGFGVASSLVEEGPRR